MKAVQIRLSMSALLVAVAVFAGAVLPLPAQAEARGTPADIPHSLAWAIEVGPADLRALPVAEQIAAADWLWIWKHLNHTAPITGDTAAYIGASRKAMAILRNVLRQEPDNTEAMWKLARLAYDLGELLDPEDRETRAELYAEMVARTSRCVELEPTAAPCLHFLATGKGRAATTRGLLSALREASSVEGAWLKAWQHAADDDVAPNGDPLKANIAYGLSVFYRLVPDLWIVRVVIGTRGDIDKSVDYIRRAHALQPDRLEIAKELGVALICRGSKKKDEANTREGRALLQAIVAGEWDDRDPRSFGDTDRRHARELLDLPASKVCAYSRDGYQEVDPDEAREAAKRDGKL